MYLDYYRYLENVDAEYAKALFESVPLRERSVIAAAIRDHIAFETSIKVEIDRRVSHYTLPI